MKDYYEENEERFGPITSFLYYLAIKLPNFRAFYNFVVDDLAKTKVERFLDVGTGPGDMPIELRKRNRSITIYAVDPSKDMIRIARFRGRNYEGLVFGIGSSRFVPFKVKFDIIYTALSFHHWYGKAKSLKYLASLLKRKGEIRIYEYNARKIKGFGKNVLSLHAVEKGELYKTAKEAGLKISRILERDEFIRATLRA